MKYRRLLRFGLLAALVPTGATAALNLPVASRVLSFVQPAPSGPLTVVVIYEPGDAGSEAEAARIEQDIGAGMVIGRVTLKARRIPVSALPGLTGVRVAFVATGIRNYAQIAAAANRGSILTITSDLACVQAGHCIVGVSNGARTQITISRAAAKAANIRFGSAFLMLVKEI